MSEAINKVNLVRVKDSRIQAVEHKEYAVLEGGQLYTYRQYSSTSISSSNVSFANVNPPSPNIFTNKVFLCQMVYNIALTQAILMAKVINL